MVIAPAATPPPAPPASAPAPRVITVSDFVAAPEAGSPAAAQGAKVVVRGGQYCLNSLRVAVPREFTRGVSYLSGTDTQAMQYLAEKHAEQQDLTFDAGSLDADASMLPPPGIAANAAKRVGVKQRGR